MNARKESLRQELLRIRQSMSSGEYAEKNRIIANKFMESVDWSKVRKVHTYRSVAVWREPDTSVIAERVRREYSEITVEYASLDKRSSIPKEVFDLIIVPTLGFDSHNHRLGLGGGWYDRFLATQPRALKVGLCFQNGFVPESLLHEPHDIPLDRLITEI